MKSLYKTDCLGEGCEIMISGYGLSEKLEVIDIELDVYRDFLKYHKKHNNLAGYEAVLKVIECTLKRKEELLAKRDENETLKGGNLQ